MLIQDTRGKKFWLLSRTCKDEGYQVTKTAVREALRALDRGEESPKLFIAQHGNNPDFRPHTSINIWENDGLHLGCHGFDLATTKKIRRWANKKRATKKGKR